jgi:hypothetical protein
VKKRGKIILAIVFFVIVAYIFLSGHFLPPLFSPAHIVINVGMNENYHNQYSMIDRVGNSTIDKIVDNTEKYGNDTTRLIKISDNISENFTDIYWPSQQNENFFCNNINSNGKSEWTWCAPFGGIFGNNPRSYGYVFDKQGRVRTLLSNDLNYDPKWIAYQKTGACEALSILFNETANRSGFVSRIVRSDGAYNCGGHLWNEILINGEWKYYDVQLYGQIKNLNDSSFWFGNRSDYGVNSGSGRCDITKFGTYVFDLQNGGYGENITQYYDPTNECPHGTHFPNDCS